MSLAAVILGFLAIALTGCPEAKTEGLDPSTLPESQRADYAIFAQRCSKCHSLSRPLNAGITDDAYWAMYVARMRRQPGSGISETDEVAVLRFLHYYSSAQKNAVAQKNEDVAESIAEGGAP
ncbi:MAG: hypothetical protein ACRELY_04705 [Polyangiaceae bacterium]